jgi:hypothetical protein
MSRHLSNVVNRAQLAQNLWHDNQRSQAHRRTGLDRQSGHRSHPPPPPSCGVLQPTAQTVRGSAFCAGQRHARQSGAWCKNEVPERRVRRRPVHEIAEPKRDNGERITNGRLGNRGAPATHTHPLDLLVEHGKMARCMCGDSRWWQGRCAQHAPGDCARHLRR